MESSFPSGFDPGTVDEEPAELGIEEKATYINNTSIQVLDSFQKISYTGNIAQKLDKDVSTIQYHIDKLKYLGLIQFYRETQDRKYFKINDEGEAVLSKLNIPTE